MLLTVNAIVNLRRSRWSSVSAAFLKNKGANVQRSTILCIVDLGSNILIGNDIYEIDKPFIA